MNKNKPIRSAPSRSWSAETPETAADDKATMAICLRVLEECAQGTHADVALRRVFAGPERVYELQRRKVSLLIFDYFRWVGWLDRREKWRQQIEEAARLAERYRTQPESFSDDDLVSQAVPDWTAAEMGITPEWVRQLQEPPRLWIRARGGEASSVAEELGQCRRVEPLPDTLEYLGEEDLFRTRGFATGAFEIQDLSSQIVGILCAPRPDEKWWDACAGEGGKTLHLSSLMNNRGLIWASDRAAWRLASLKKRAGRARVFNYRAVPWEGGKLPTKTRFDGVLVDAPCTGIGTWQRNPHARWTTSAVDVHELAEIQRRLLGTVTPAVKVGGRLIYAVCSLARRETEDVAAWFTAEFPQFEPVPLVNPLRPQKSPGKDSRPKATNALWLRPEEFGSNGMYIAAWRRRND